MNLVDWLKTKGQVQEIPESQAEAGKETLCTVQVQRIHFVLQGEINL